MVDSATYWQVEEKAEDAFVAYLTPAILDHRVYISTGFTANKPQYPAIFVNAEESNNVSEGLGFDGNRAVSVVLSVRSSIFTDRNESYRTSRDEHAVLKSKLMMALAQTDLKDLLNAKTGGSIAFSMAIIESLVRTVNTEENYFQTSITVECYVRPRQA